MNWQNKVTVCFILIFLSSVIYGQQVRPFFKTYSKEFLGLNENGVMSVYEDPEGFLWFCTINGLKRWDGFHFKAIPVNPDNPKALPDPRVSSIVMDKKGNYWIVNRSGLMKYNPAKPIDSSVTRLDKIHESFKNIPDLSNISKPLQLRIDRYGTIWTAVNEQNGILKIDPEKPAFDFLTVYSEDRKTLLNFYDVQIDTVHDVIWALSKNHGVCKINIHTGKTTLYENVLRKELQLIWKEKADILSRSQFWWSQRGFLWCMSQGKPLVHFDLKTLKASIFPVAGLDIYPNNPAYEWERCLEDRMGNFWITNFQKGVIFISYDTKKAAILTADVSDLGSLAHNLTNKISMDNSGNVWITHRKAGVSCFSYYNPGPHTLYPLKLAKEQNPDNYHIDVHFDESSNENLFTYTGVYQKKYGSDKYYPVDKISQKFLQTNDNYKWTNEDNKIQYHGSEGKKKLPLNIHSVISKHTIGRFQEFGPNNGIWMIVPDDGLYRYNTHSGNLVKVSQDKDLFFNKNERPVNIHFDRKGQLWLHLNNGFALLHNNNTFSKWTDSGPDAVTLIKAPVEHMTIDINNHVWLIARNKILKFDGRSFSTMDHLLPYPYVRNLSIYSIKNNIWIGNLSGSVQYDLESEYSTYYPVENGVYKIRSDSFGKIALLNLETISYIYLDQKNAKEFNPKISVTDFKIFEDSHGHLLNNNNIHLSHNQNFITFYFANHDFLQSEKQNFTYKLEGIDKDWVSPSDGRKFASYSNLPPGHFTFTVRMYTNRDKSDFVEDSVNLTIKSPWYRTYWFFIIIAILITSIIWYFIRVQFDKRLLIKKGEIEKQYAVENERSRIARDMHDDLGSGLSAINLLSNFLKKEKLDEAAYQQIEKIASSSHDLNQKLREIIWSMNPGHDYIQNLADFIRRYLDDMQDMNPSYRIHFDLPEGLPDVNIHKSVQKELFLCMKEAVNNALKHGKGDKITVTLQMNDKYLYTSIHDNGYGFDINEALKNGGNGLHNLRYRMEKIGGTVQFLSDNGCRVVLNWPVQSHPGSSGTEQLV